MYYGKFVGTKYGFSEELLTTATFIEVMARWFDLVNSRHHGIALSKRNSHEYNKAISHLEEVEQLFQHMYVFFPLIYFNNFIMLFFL